MKKLVVVAALAALVLAGGTEARSAKQITIQLGDQIDVVGTSIFCQTQIGKTQLKGKKLVACYKVRKNAAIVGSYAPALAADGELAVAKVTAKGAAIVFRRKPARVHKTVRLNVGDAVLLAGTSLACAVGKSSRPYLSCFLVVPQGGKPGTFSYAIGDGAVAVLQFTTPSKTKLVKSFPQPA